MHSSNLKFSVILLLFVFVICSCKKENHTHASPEVIINLPVANQEYSSTDTIIVSGNTSDEEGLHEGLISIVRSSDDSVLVSVEQHVHEIKSYDYNEQFVLSVAVATPAKVVVDFENHDDKTTLKEVSITLNP